VLKKQAIGEMLDAARVATLFVVGFTLSLVVVVQYQDALYKINWALVALIFLVSGGSFMVYRFNMRRGNTYDVLDLFMTNGIADIGKHMILFFAGLSAWVIVQKMLLDPKGDITGLVTIVLGTFVAKEVLGRFADAIRDRPAAPPPSGDQNVNVLPAVTGNLKGA
jgi:hypothetical protein